MKTGLLALAALFTLSSCVHTSPKGQDPVQVINLKPRPDHSRTPAQDVDWFAAKEAQIAQATCRTRLPVSTNDILKYYRNLPPEPGLENGQTEIKGIVFENERPQLLLALAKLLSPKDDEDIKVPADFQKAFSVNPSCKKVLCAAQKIFGTEVGPQMIFLMDRFNVNTSPYSFVNATPFNADEVADVIRSFELLLPGQTPFDDFNKQLSRFLPGKTLALYGDDGGSVLANASMQLFDGWGKEKSLIRQYALFHEFAHNFSRSYFTGIAESGSWMRLSPWKKVKTEGPFAKYIPYSYQSDVSKMMAGHPFVSKYAKENPAEDFAESIMAYRLNPALLQKQSPEKYQLIKQIVFDGIEFQSEKNCRKQGQSKVFQAEINKTGGGLDEKDYGSIVESCGTTFYQTILANVPASFFSDCVNYEATLAWYSKKPRHYKDLISTALFDKNLRLSTLKFPKVQKDLTEKLVPEAAEWIATSVKDFSYRQRADASKEEYCEVWTDLQHRNYPHFKSDSEWNNRSFDREPQISPLPGAARGLCLDLYKAPVPTPKSSPETIGSWLRKKLYLQNEEPPVQEAPRPEITKEDLIRYIKMRMGH